MNESQLGSDVLGEYQAAKTRMRERRDALIVERERSEVELRDIMLNLGATHAEICEALGISARRPRAKRPAPVIEAHDDALSADEEAATSADVVAFLREHGSSSSAQVRDKFGDAAAKLLPALSRRGAIKAHGRGTNARYSVKP